jgi:gluconolactonase
LAAKLAQNREVRMQIVAEGLRVPEGPVVLDDGSLLVVEVMGGVLTRVKPDGTTQTVATLGGGPNGAALGPDGAAYVCNNGGLQMTWAEGRLTSYGPVDGHQGGMIQRVDLATGKAEVLYDSCDGRRLDAPNDIVFDDTGGFWFTDSGSRHPTHKNWGALYYARPDGGRIERVREGMPLPNGVGLSPDQKTVYVADSLTNGVWGCELGALRIADVPAWTGRQVGRQTALAGLDSLAVEESGRVCIASGPNRICVITPDQGTDNVEVPDFMPTNICFGGADMRDAWITGGAGGRLLKTRWERPGVRLSFQP